MISYDGFVDVTITLANVPPQFGPPKLQNTSLTVSITAAASKFFMGIGVQGRNRTTQYPNGETWKWAENKGGENQLLAGSTTAGLRLKYKGDEFDWETPLHMHSAAPQSWGGEGGGQVSALPTASGGLATTACAATALDTDELQVRHAGGTCQDRPTLDYGRHFRRDRYYQYGYNGHADCRSVHSLCHVSVAPRCAFPTLCRCVFSLTIVVLQSNRGDGR